MALRLQNWRSLVALSAIVFVVVAAFPSPAQAACSQDTTKTTSSSQSTIDSRTAYWTSSTNTGGSPCSDINVINQNRSTSVTGAYYSGTFGQWIAGAAGWIFGPQYELIPVVTNITPSGVPFKTGSAVGSTVQRQLS
jgi:hypothetical protein